MGDARFESRLGHLLLWRFSWNTSVALDKYRDSTSITPRPSYFQILSNSFPIGHPTICCYSVQSKILTSARSCLLGWPFYHEDRSSMFLRKVGKLLPDYTAWRPRSYSSSHWPPWEPHIHLVNVILDKDIRKRKFKVIPQNTNHTSCTSVICLTSST